MAVPTPFDARATTLSGVAYGHPTIAFFDAGCTRPAGCDWYLTIGTFGYDSIYGPGPRPIDPGTGFPIMTTYFGANPIWGTTIDGNASTCSGSDVKAVCSSLTHFEFRIDASQFQSIVGSLSRSVPGFSSNVANHEVHDFHFNNEVSGAGALGMTLRNATLKSYY